MNSIKIATWNCRDLHNSIPYFQRLFIGGVDILVLQEHWLWPFELDQLGSIDHEYTYAAVCDNRLSSSSSHTRGCRGCALLWQKPLPKVPVISVESDRLCSIQVSLDDSNPLTIIGVYMPSSDYPQETYNEYMNAVNQAISVIPTSNPLMLVGDLNCKMGNLCGPRSSSDPNQHVLFQKNLLLPSTTSREAVLLVLTHSHPSILSMLDLSTNHGSARYLMPSLLMRLSLLSSKRVL